LLGFFLSFADKQARDVVDRDSVDQGLNQTGPRAQRCQGAGCSAFVQVATLTGTSFNDTGLIAGTSYSYRVRAADAAGNLGAYSNIASATTPTPDTTAPSAPTGLSATAASSAQINLAWTASTDNVGVTGYRVERCQGAGCVTFAQVATPTGTSFSDTGLIAGTSYSYQVRAADAAGNLSAYSNVASATTSNVPLGLVAAYAFNEGSGTTVADVSGNNNNGTIGAATWTTAGKFGSALMFNGTSAQVTVPNATSLQLTTGMTLEAWVFPTGSLASWRAVLDKNVDGYYLMASSDPNNRPAVGGTWTGGNQNTAAPTALALNAWTHLAATFDGATVRLYVNGAQVASQAQTTPLATTTGTLQIGGDSYPNEFFAGGIDEVRIYNRALTQAEIQSDMATPVGGTPPPPDTTAPSAPTGLGATAASATQVNLSWTASTDNVGVAGYRVERCQGAACSTFAQVATPTATSFSDTGLTAGTSYSYRVRAADAAGNLGAYSNIASATTPAAPDTTPPTAPTVLSATVGSTSQIDLSWTASSDNVGVTGYQVDRCQGTGCSTFAQIGTSSVTSYSDTGLAAGTTYRYRVRATDAAGNVSANSSIVTATTQAVPDTTPPGAPTGLSATATSSVQISLAWVAATDNVVITISSGATVDAGPVQIICAGNNATLAGTFSGASGITWTTAGDGTFNNANLTNAIYTPGANDIAAGTVSLTITTGGPCAAAADNVIITINPAATVDAGSPQITCAATAITLSGTFSGSATGLKWTTAGDGTFSDDTDPSSTYTPGVNDIAAGSVVLTATATGTCTGVTDNVTITVNPVATVDAGTPQVTCGAASATSFRSQ